MNSYADFLNKKAQIDGDHGFPAIELPSMEDE